LTANQAGAGPRSTRLLSPSFLLITTLTLLYFLSVGMAIPVLPRYVEGPLGGGNLAVGLVTGAFGVSAVVMRPFAGRFSDQRGRRPLVVAGATLAAASIFGYRFAPAIGPLILLRLVNGVGEALWFVGAASVVNDLAPAGRRGEALSYFSLAVFTGLGAGPFLGEWVLGPGRFDPVWIIAAVLALGTGLGGLALSETRPPWDAGRRPAPLLHKAALVPGLLLASSIWGMGGFFAFVPLHALNIGMDGARVVLAAYAAIILAIRSLGARIPDRLGPYRTVGLSLGWSIVGLGMVAASTTAALLFAGTALFALGQSLAFPALMTLAVEGADPSERGAVVATFTAFFDLSFGLGAGSLGAVASVTGEWGAFAGGAVVAAIGLGGLLWHVHRSRSRTARAAS
jgi:MFS family permease